MRVSVLCIGDELLNGDTVNTDLATLGEELARAGYRIREERCVPDTDHAIRCAITDILPQSDLVVTVGGLGPTRDDRTRDAVAGVLGIPVVHSREVEARIRRHMTARGIRFPQAAIANQSRVPAGAIILDNPNGTAPGLLCRTDDGKAVMLLPGPPGEFAPLVRDALLPTLRDLGPADMTVREVVAAGIPESQVAATVEPALEAFPEVSIAYCARPSGIMVRLSAAPDSAACADRAEAEARAALGVYALPPGCGTVADALGCLLRERGMLMATAESCTGGLIAGALTDTPGSSDYVAGGAVTYSNACKHALLGVAEETLARFGAVSEETVAEMLAGACERFSVRVAVAVSGIAGPGGGTPEKPVGLVYIGTLVDGSRRVRRVVFPGNRHTVRLRTVWTAISQLRMHLLEQQSNRTDT